MMITVSELEAIIAQTPPGKKVQHEAKPIGSVDYVTRKLTELKLSRSSDPDYLIFVGIDRFGECFLAAFSTIGDPLEFRARHERRLVLLSQKVAADGPENQIIEEIQILAGGGPDESQARRRQRSTICGVC